MYFTLNGDNTIEKGNGEKRITYIKAISISLLLFLTRTFLVVMENLYSHWLSQSIDKNCTLSSLVRKA